MLKQHYYRYSMLLPGLLIFLIFFIFPAFSSFFYAFTNLDASFRFTRFVGLDNFISMFDNADNLLTFKNTFIFTGVTTFFKISLGLLLAVLANQKLKTTLFLRSMLFFPAVLSAIAVALAFTAVLHPVDGIFNLVLRALHLNALAQSWLTNTHIVIYSISFVEVWKWIGLNMMLFLAALQSIPREVSESASMDGATSWKQLRHITIPMIFPVLNTNIILCLIGGLKVFDIVYALTGGGPGNASNVINTMVYKSFSTGRTGEAIAANLFLFLIILILVLAVNKLLNKDTER